MSKHNSRHNSRFAEPSNEEIARLAYSFFETEGRADGHDVEHWLRAKKQLSKDRSSGDKPQRDAEPKSTPTSNDAKEKSFSASPLPSRGEDRYAQAYTGR